MGIQGYKRVCVETAVSTQILFVIYQNLQVLGVVEALQNKGCQVQNPAQAAVIQRFAAGA